MGSRTATHGWLGLLLLVALCEGTGWSQPRVRVNPTHPAELDATCSIARTSGQFLTIKVDYNIPRATARSLSLRGRAIVAGQVDPNFESTNPKVQAGSRSVELTLHYVGEKAVKVDEFWVELMAEGLASPVRYKPVPYGKVFPELALLPPPETPALTVPIMSGWKVTRISPNEVKVSVVCDTRGEPGDDIRARADLLNTIPADPNASAERAPDALPGIQNLAPTTANQGVELRLIYRGQDEIDAAGVRLRVERTGDPTVLQQVDIPNSMRLRPPGPEKVRGTGNSLSDMQILDESPSKLSLTVRYKLAENPEDYPKGFRIETVVLNRDGDRIERIKARNLKPIRETGTGTVPVFVKYLGDGQPPSTKLRLKLVGLTANDEAELLAQTTYDHRHTWGVETDVMALSLGVNAESPDKGICGIMYAYERPTKNEPTVITALPCKDGNPLDYFTAAEVPVKKTGCTHVAIPLTFVGGNRQPKVGMTLTECDTDGILVRLKSRATGEVFYEELLSRPAHWEMISRLEVTGIRRPSPWVLEVDIKAMPGPNSIYEGELPWVEVRLLDEKNRLITFDRNSWDWENTCRNLDYRAGVGAWYSWTFRYQYKGTEDLDVRRINFVLCNKWDRGPSKADAMVQADVNMLWPSALIGWIPEKYADAMRVPGSDAPQTWDHVPVFAGGAEYRCSYDRTSDLLGESTGKPWQSLVEGEQSVLSASDVIAVIMPNRPGLVGAEKETFQTRDDSGNAIDVYKLEDCTFRWLGSVAILEIHARWRNRGVPKVRIRVISRDTFKTDAKTNEWVHANDVVIDKETDANGDWVWQPIPKSYVGHTFRVEILPSGKTAKLLPQTPDLIIKDGYNQFTADLAPAPEHTGMVAMVKFGRCKCKENQEIWGDEVYVATSAYQAYGDQTFEAEAWPRKLTNADDSDIHQGDEFLLTMVNREQEKIADDQMLYQGDPGAGGLEFTITTWEEDARDHKQENEVWKAVDEGLKAIPYVGSYLSLASEIVRIIWDAFGDEDDKMDVHEYDLSPELMGQICDGRNFCLRKGKPGTPGANEPLTSNKNLWGGSTTHEWEFTGDSAWGADYRYRFSLQTYVLPAWGELDGYPED